MSIQGGAPNQGGAPESLSIADKIKMFGGGKTEQKQGVESDTGGAEKPAESQRSSPSTGRFTASKSPQGKGLGARPTQRFVDNERTFMTSGKYGALRPVKERTSQISGEAKAGEMQGMPKGGNRASRVARRTIVIPQGQTRFADFKGELPPLPKLPTETGDNIGTGKMPPLPDIPKDQHGGAISDDLEEEQVEGQVEEQQSDDSGGSTGTVEGGKTTPVPDRKDRPTLQRQSGVARGLNELVRPTPPKRDDALRTRPEIPVGKPVKQSAAGEAKKEVKAGLGASTADVQGRDASELGATSADRQHSISDNHKTARSQISTIGDSLSKLGKKQKLRASLSDDGKLTTRTKTRKGGLFGKSGKSEGTKESVETILTVMEGIMKDGPQDARKDVFHALNSFENSKWGKSILKSNPELKQRFDAIENKFKGPDLELTESDLGSFKGILESNKGDMERMGYRETANVMERNKGIVSNLLFASGIDATKTVDIIAGHRQVGTGQIELQDFLGVRDSDNSGSQIIDSVLDETQFMLDNPEEGFALVASKEYAMRVVANKDPDGISKMNVIQKASKYPIAGTEVFNTYTKYLDRMLDGFCENNIIAPERLDADEGDSLRGMQLARNNMIQSKLSDVPGFENFLTDRAAINTKIHALRRNATPNPEALEEVLGMINDFQAKYEPLAAQNKDALAQIRAEVPPKLPMMYTTTGEKKIGPQYDAMFAQYAPADFKGNK